MDRIVVAFEGETNQARIKDMLESGGISISRACRSGAEAIRTVKKLGGGIVICSYRLGDMTASELAYDLHRIAMVLAIAPASQMALCENEELFKLPAPVTRSDLLASVRMLTQMQGRYLRMMLPRRSGEEEELVKKAKELLINRNCMTEEEAHRFLQKKSMDTGSKMVDTARMIIGT
jgi:response regulator NasT